MPNLFTQVFRPPGSRPAALGVSRTPDLRGDVNRVGIGVQCFANGVVGEPRAVGVAGVEVGDAQLDGRAKHRERAVPVGRRTHDPRTGELHRAVAETGDGEVAEHPGAAGEGCGGRIHDCAFHKTSGVVPNGVLLQY